MNSEINRIAKTLLKVHEGCVLTQYKCTAGHNTIGYGWNMDAHPLPESFGRRVNGKLTISRLEAETLLEISIDTHWQELIHNLPWVTNLDHWRQAAMLDLAFNMGVAGLLKFTNTLGFLQKGNYAQASKNLMQSKWAGQVKTRAAVISTIIRTGDLPNDIKRAYKFEE